MRLEELVPGDYTLQAEDVTSDGTLFEVLPPNPQTVAVVADHVSVAKVVYEELKGFRLSSAKPKGSLSFDQTRIFSFSIVRAPGFDGEISATLSGLPTGVTADQTSFVLDGESTGFEVELTEAAATNGTYPLTLKATSPDADGERSLSFSLEVGPIVNSDQDEVPSVPGQLSYLVPLPRSDVEPRLGVLALSRPYRRFRKMQEKWTCERHAPFAQPHLQLEMRILVYESTGEGWLW